MSLSGCFGEIFWALILWELGASLVGVLADMVGTLCWLVLGGLI